MRQAPILSTLLDDPSVVPYFMWDEPMTVGELRHRMASGSSAERIRLLGKVLREARDTDVWRFTSPAEILGHWADLSRHLGRRKQFWEFLMGEWRRQGLLGR